MKKCEFCGSHNANRAKFCADCGAPFASSSNVRGANAETIDVEPISEQSEIATYEASEDDISNAAGAFASTVGSSFLAIAAASGRLSARLIKPLFRALLNVARDMLLRATAPASTWGERTVPNFLYWAIVQACLTRQPLALVGVVYAALAKDARSNCDYETGKRRASAARVWLFADLALWLVATVARNLVFTK